ncbi:putative transposase [Salinibacter ruber]|nr:transposase [Salinibacter ruber]MCS4044797.1 putative transposase [Salinibacter ruber]
MELSLLWSCRSWGHMNLSVPGLFSPSAVRQNAMYLTRKLKLGRTDQLDRLARRAGKLWSTVAKWHWRFVDRQGYWLSKGQAQKMYCKGFDGLHSQSAQAIADSFYDSLQSWRKKRDNGSYEGLRPPYKQKRYFKVQWKSSAIKLRDDGVLRLSNGRGTDPVLIDWPSGQEPKRGEIGWDGSQYELRCQQKVYEDQEPRGQKKAGVDLGERHLATVYTEKGENISVHGGRLRSLRRHHNRTLGNLRSKIDRKEKGSRRWKRLIRAKNRQLQKIRNRIEDFLHKTATRLVNTLHERRVGSVVVGDLTGIRERISYGSRMNQRLHQWAYSKFEHMLTYKAQLRGQAAQAGLGSLHVTDVPKLRAQTQTEWQRLQLPAVLV